MKKVKAIETRRAEELAKFLGLSPSDGTLCCVFLVCLAIKQKLLFLKPLRAVAKSLFPK